MNAYTAADVALGGAQLTKKAGKGACYAVAAVVIGPVLVSIYAFVWAYELAVWIRETYRRRPFSLEFALESLTFTPIPGTENIGHPAKVARAKERRAHALALQANDQRPVVEGQLLAKIGAWYDKAAGKTV